MTAVLMMLLLGVPQEKPVSAKQVDQAQGRAVAWLFTQKISEEKTEFVLLALLRSGVPENRLEMKRLLESVIENELRTTRQAAWRARMLEDLNRVKYQRLIHDCAQFLVDNQAPDGRWGPGEPTTYLFEFPDVLPPRAPRRKRPGLRRFGGLKVKPKAFHKFPVTKNREGKAGDLSNTLVAVQGLHACHEAGIVLPKEILARALEAVRSAPENGRRGDGVETARVVSTLSILRHLSKEDWKNDSTVNAGLAWLGSCSEWEAPTPEFLYAVRRAGRLYGTERIGDIDWYPRGGRVLISSQKMDGSWNGSVDDTCSALLFLAGHSEPCYFGPRG